MEIHALTALELLRHLELRELTSEDVVRALFARIEAHDGSINSVVHRFQEQALASARHADEARRGGVLFGPLHGVPITIKESIATRGTATTLGVKAQLGTPAKDDAVVVRAARQAGAIVIGKTNVSQTLLFNEATNPIWGTTNNPWSSNRSPGGSSGGEAAALAAGFTPLGIGTDIGGSIRVPAAYCGVVGFKPTVDRWSMQGCRGAMPGQEGIRSQCGPMARTSKDVALLFRAADSIHQHALDPTVPPLRTPDPASVDLSRITVGYYEDDGFLSPSPAIQRGVREAAIALRAKGVPVVPFALPRPVELTYLYFALVSADGGRTLEKLLAGDSVVPQLLPLKLMARMPNFLRGVATAFVASQGEQRLERLLAAVNPKTVTDYWALIAERNSYRQEMLAAWEHAGIDAVLCPAHTTPALRHGQSRDFSIGGSYAMHYNLLNFPAGVVPVTRVLATETVRPAPRDRVEKVAAAVDADSAGLPVAVQLATRPHQDHVCLALMIALEEALADKPDRPRTPVPVA